MKKPILLAALLLFIMCKLFAQQKQVAKEQVPNFFKVREQWLDKIKNSKGIESYFDEPDGLYAKYKRWEYFMLPRTYPSGNYFRSDAVMNEFVKYKSRQNSNSQLQSTNWNLLGPFTDPPTAYNSKMGSGIGRLNCIALHPADSNIIYVGAACGGIWKTADGGQTWACSSDQLPSMSISSIAINPNWPDTIYAATGDAPATLSIVAIGIPVDFPGGHYSAGLLMSTDGGLTWNQTGLTYALAQSALINKVLVNPVQTNVILTATLTGLFRSADGGTTWAQVDTGIIHDILINPLNAAEIYSVNGRKLRRSHDYGVTWSNSSYLFPLPVEGVTHLAISDADTSKILALRMTGILYRSTNGGNSFSQLYNVGSVFSHQGPYDKIITMSPLDANTVYIGMVPLIKSTNGGTIWTQINSSNYSDSNFIHVDCHGLQIAPYNPNKIYAVTDGGIHVSNNNGSTWTALNNGISITQFYRISSSFTRPDLMLGGTQDNGTFKFDGGNWDVAFWADGMDGAFDFTDENFCYESLYYGGFNRSTDAGVSISANITPPGIVGNWLSPFAMNPLNSSNIFIGGKVVYNSYDKGNTWQTISPVIDNVYSITTLKTAPADSDFLVASSHGVLYKTTNHGVNWTSIVAGLPVDSAAISDVAVGDDPLNMWVTFSGFKDGLKIFRTIDGGLNWTNISGTLPNIPFSCIEYQKGTVADLYAGSDFGVFYRNDTMSDWITYNNGMPGVMISDLDINYGNGKLRAATFGRGLYETDPEKPVQMITTDAGVARIIYPQPDYYCNNQLYLVSRIRNYGTDTLVSLTVNYQVDNGIIYSLPWTGSLARFESVTDTIAQLNLTGGNHDIHVFTSDPNGTADQFAGNDHKNTSIFIDSLIVPNPLTEDFESGIWPPQNWSLSGDAILWMEETTHGGFGLSTHSARTDCFWITSGQQNLISPRVDLTSISAPAILSFSHAYKRFDASTIDTLVVSISSDCGNNWTPVYAKWDSALATVQAFTILWLYNNPAPNDWVTDSIDISSYTGQKINVRFEIHSGFGNSCYIDDINVGHGVGIEEIQLDKLVLVPNPSDGLLYLIDKSNSIKNYQVFNYNGQLIQDKLKGNGVIDLSGLNTGLYFIKLNTGTQSVVKKISLMK